MRIFLRLTLAGMRLISWTSTPISIIGSKASTSDLLINGINVDDEVSWTITAMFFHRNSFRICTKNEPKFFNENDNLFLKILFIRIQ